MDLLLSAYQKLYSALQSIERFNKGQDLFDNIACIDNFLSEFRNVTFVLHKSLAHTDYLSVYKQLCEQYLSNPHCSWLKIKRNEIQKEKPFSLEKQLILRIYLPYSTGVFPTECFTIEDEVDYSSLIDMVKRVISNIPALEVFFSTEFIYKEVGKEVNLFETIDRGIESLQSMLFAIDEKIGAAPSQERKTLLSKIDKLLFHKTPKEAWFVDDYVFYREDGYFEKGQRYEMITPHSTGVKCSDFCNILKMDLTDDFIQDTFEAFKRLHIVHYAMQKSLMPTILVLNKDGILSMTMYQASIKTTTYRKIYELASEIKKNTNIVAVFLVGEMIYYDDLNMLNQDYRYRIANLQSEVLAFDKITKDKAEEYLISSEAIIDNSKDCMFPTLTEIESHQSSSMIYPIIKAFSEQS
ncbi:MAG: hypothetical protein J6V59_05295 [Alistipes sp.]|nr:hypothetical protein [Alistipes sp.]